MANTEKSYARVPIRRYVAVEDDARIFIQRVRANEYSNESQLRFAFQIILPQIIGFGEA